jgi:hypothetical protein
MSDAGVALDAGNGGPCVAGRVDSAGQIGVAFHAGSIGHAVVASRDSNFVGKPLCGESPGVEEAIQCFGGVLGEEAGGSMAVVADGPLAMARTEPAGMLIAHDVAVGAGIGIIGEVGTTLGITEGEQSYAEEDAARNAQQDPRGNSCSSPCRTHHSIIVHAGRSLRDASHKR